MYLTNQETSASYLRKNLSAGISNKDARIITVSFTDHNPFKARDIVSTIDSAYMEKSVEFKNQSNTKRIDYINNELKRSMKIH